MKENLKTILALANAILYLGAVAVWTILPELAVLKVVVAVVAIAMSVFIAWLFRDVASVYMASARFRKFFSSSLSAFIIFAILALVGHLAWKHPMQIDLTANKMNSLTSQTKSILTGLNGPIAFTFFNRKGQEGTIAPLLELYRMEKNDVRIEQIDPELSPARTGEFGIDREGSLVVEYKGKKKIILSITEKEISLALLALSREKNPIIYFIEGHGELELSRVDNTGISKLGQLLKEAFYDVRTLSIAQKNGVPLDASLVVILGPNTPFLPVEINALKKFVASGGSILAGIGPSFKNDVNQALRKFFTEFGLDVSNDIAVDRGSFVDGSQGLVPIARFFSEKHPVTRFLRGSVFFPLASSVNILKSKINDFRLEGLVFTSDYPESWAKKDVQKAGEGQTLYVEGTDEKGPVILAATSEPIEGKGSKIIAIGNAAFVANAYFNHGRNTALFLNMVAWPTGDETSISFDRPDDKPDYLHLNQTQAGLLLYFTVFFLPLILFAFGGAVYFRRKKM